MKSYLIIVALAIGANADGHTDDIATYQPASDVEEHAKIDLDFRDFRTQLEQGDWDDAWAAYADGGNSVKGDGFRTLRGFSKDLSGEATFDEYMAYHGNAKYADDYIRAILWDRLSDDSSAKVDPRPELFATTSLSDTMVQRMATTGANLMHVFIYSTHELYSALDKCEAGNLDDESGAPHAWDEGWAFYAGSRADGSRFGSNSHRESELLYEKADQRGDWFGTYRARLCNSDACPAGETCCWSPAWREEDDDQHSNVNAKLLKLYRAGLVALRAGDCARASSYTDEIVAQMTVILAQNAVKYTFWADDDQMSQWDDGSQVGHFHASVYALLPRVAHCDAAAAAILEANMVLPEDSDPPAAAPLVPDGKLAVKAAIESTYPCLGITCADVGGFDFTMDGVRRVVEICDDGSSVDDRAAYWAELDAIHASGELPASGGGGGGSCKDNTSKNSCKQDALGCKWKKDKCKSKGGSCKDNTSKNSCKSAGCKWKKNKAKCVAKK